MSFSMRASRCGWLSIGTAGDRRRPRLISRPLLLLYAAIIGGETSFYLLLAAVPLSAPATGGRVGAGLVTGLLMAGTLAAELITTRLVARVGYGWAFTIGLLLLGVPALALLFAPHLPIVMLVCIVRGLGFGISTVIASALVASLVPDERRGEALGLYGVAVGIPAIVGLPLGVWLAEHAAYQLALVAGAALPLAGAAAAPTLHGTQQQSAPAVGILASLRAPSLRGPAIAFWSTATAAGVVATFLPFAMGTGNGDLAALALLLESIASTLTRWWAGRWSDRHGTASLLVSGVLTGVCGMLTLVLVPSPMAALVGMALFGAGFGIAQNASLALMFDRATIAEYGVVSAVWNLAYDAGWGTGAAGFGVLVAGTGYAVGFAVLSALMLAALAPAALPPPPWGPTAWHTRRTRIRSGQGIPLPG
jgi:MFS family permease